MTGVSDLKLWWVGWEVPDELPQSAMLDSWPDGMRGWPSGDTNCVWVGAVWALSPQGGVAPI